MFRLTTASKALHAALQAAPALQGIPVEHCTPQNVNPDLTPWIGVYPATKEYNPRTIGGPRNWQCPCEIVVVVQYAAARDPDAAMTELETILEEIEQVIVNDLTISGSVEMVNSLSIQYDFQRTDSQTLVFRQAALTVAVELATG